MDGRLRYAVPFLILLMITIAAGTSAAITHSAALSPAGSSPQIAGSDLERAKADGLVPIPPQVPVRPVPPGSAIRPEEGKRDGLLVPLDETFTPLTRPVISKRGGPSGPLSAYTVRLRSREFVPEENGAALLASQGFQSPGTGELDAAVRHCVIQFRTVPTQAERLALEAAGVRLDAYLPDLSWFATVPAGISPDALSGAPVRATFVLSADDRLAPEIRENRIGDWARPRVGTVDLVVRLYADVQIDAAKSALEGMGGEVLFASSHFHRITVRIAESAIPAIGNLAWTTWISPVAPPPAMQNDGSRASIRVDPIQAAPYDLSGSGVNIGIWDGGAVQDHIGFTGRLTRVENDLADYTEAEMRHATHVAGTVGGSGAGSEGDILLRGMSTLASIFSWDYDDDVPTEMRDGRTNWGIQVSQNSWVQSITADNCADFGDYDAWSPDFDQIVREDGLFIVFAAGNYRSNGICGIGVPDGYGSMAPPAGAKNIVSVGAVSKAPETMADYSDWGPTDDGRLKPDLVAVGGTTPGPIVSTVPGDIYEGLQGTSMAAPAVSGAAGLLYQRYNQIFGSWPTPALVKSLLLNTATDLGPAGPDYQNGYGLVDAQEAVLAMDRRAWVESWIEDGAVQEISLPVTNHLSHVRVLLTWTDPQGAENAAPALVNDLDLVLIDPNGVEHSPWVLDPAHPGNAATHGSNHRDNAEQVVIDAPVVPGIWTARVTGTQVPTGPQSYALTWDWDAGFAAVPFTNGSPPDYRNDDGSTDVFALPFPFSLYGTIYDHVYINNNGNVSFEGPYYQYTSTGFPVTGYGMVAPFWADVDTRGGAPSGIVWYKMEPHRMTVIWDRVGYFSGAIDKVNTFELILTDGTDPLIGIGNNACFSYGDMQWTTGSASGGSGGFYGTPATVGANAGDGSSFSLIGRFDHPGIDYDGPGGAADGISWLDGRLFVFRLGQGAGTVAGTVFQDTDGDCIFDPEETALSGWTIVLDPGGAAATSTTDGSYIFSFLAPGDYTIHEVLRPNWEQTCPVAPGTYNVTVTPGSNVTGIDFGNRANNDVQDLTVSLAGGPTRRGFFTTYGVSWQNLGTVPIAASAVFHLPAELTFDSADNGGTFDPGTWTVSWDLGTVPPGGAGWLKARAYLPPGLPLGTVLHSWAEVLPMDGDIRPDDNMDHLMQTVTGSFDPNDKLVTPLDLVARDEVLTYQVRFQNVGTDTAFTVVVRDTLDPALDITSLVLGATSHPYLFNMNQRELTWTFNDIELPDTSHSEPGSHGFLKFHVRARTDAALGAVVRNQARVYFDFNPPVITNFVENTVWEPPCEIVCTIADSVWTQVGVRVQADPNAAIDVFGSLLPGLDVVQNDEGGSYLPRFGLDELGPARADGYRVWLNGEPDTLVVTGALVHGDTLGLAIKAGRWNLIPYLSGSCDPNCRPDAAVAFASIAGCVAIVKDDAGNSWIPTYGIADLAPLDPCKAYMVYLNDGCTDQELRYPECDGVPAPGRAAPSGTAAKMAAPHFKAIRTGLPEIVVIAECDAGFLEVGDEVGIFADDLLVGSAICKEAGAALAVPVWRADAAHGLPGFRPESTMRLEVWKSRTGRTVPAFLATKDGAASFQFAPVLAGRLVSRDGQFWTPGDPKEERITQVELRAIRPNPSAGRTTVEYAIPAVSDVRFVIYDVGGRVVRELNEGRKNAGRHVATWDGRDREGRPVSKGIYYVRMRSDSTALDRRIVIVQ